MWPIELGWGSEASGSKIDYNDSNVDIQQLQGFSGRYA